MRIALVAMLAACGTDPEPMPHDVVNYCKSSQCIKMEQACTSVVGMTFVVGQSPMCAIASDPRLGVALSGGCHVSFVYDGIQGCCDLGPQDGAPGSPQITDFFECDPQP